MPRSSITFLLLLAVFATQILGGKTCCCSTRLLGQFANDAVSHLGATHSQSSKPVTNRNSAPGCPKCAHAVARQPASSPPVDGFALCETSNCNCSDHAIVATADRAEPMTNDSQRDSASKTNFVLLRSEWRGENSYRLSSAENRRHSYSPSWQSLACTWRL